MGIINLELLIDDTQQVVDILEDLNDLYSVTITEDGVGHVYFGDDIATIEEDLLFKRVLSYFIVKRSYGFEVEIEV